MLEIESQSIKITSSIFKKNGETKFVAGQDFWQQLALSEYVIFTIVGLYRSYAYLSNFDDNWGKEGLLWKGRMVKSWAVVVRHLTIYKNLNSVSLYELNEGL